MGIMFLIFSPVPYVDASSSWALTSKWKRAIVGAAGRRKSAADTGAVPNHADVSELTTPSDFQPAFATWGINSWRCELGQRGIAPAPERFLARDEYAATDAARLDVLGGDVLLERAHGDGERGCGFALESRLVLPLFQDVAQQCDEILKFAV